MDGTEIRKGRAQLDRDGSDNYNFCNKMKTWHEPPIAKIYEALGAVADGRVTLTSTTSAKVGSSSGDKSYTVEWAADFSWITSNDNASFWQGYLGYPIIAVLLLKGKIAFSKETSEALKGVPWKQINTRHKNDYDKAIKEVLGEISTRGVSPQAIIKECERIHDEVKELKLEKPARERKRPPVSKEPTNLSNQEKQGSLL